PGALHHLAQAPRLGERARLGDAREVVGHGDLVRLRGIAVDRMTLHAHCAALAVEAVVGPAPLAVGAHGMPDHHRDHLLPPLVNLAPSGYSHTPEARKTQPRVLFGQIVCPSHRDGSVAGSEEPTRHALKPLRTVSLSSCSRCGGSQSEPSTSTRAG